MGFQFGLERDANTCFPRKFRWLFGLDDITPFPNDTSVNVLPPRKAARPQLTFKDMEAQHLSETVFFPGKAEWKPINITLWEMPKAIGNPVFEWVRRAYRPEPQSGSNSKVWTPSVDCDSGQVLGEGSFTEQRFKRSAILFLLSGCGDCMEKWVFQNAWPQTINWGDLDMGNSEVVTVDITLRYDRAFWLNCRDGASGGSCSSDTALSGATQQSG